jgi:hypothetical protein
MIPLPDDIEMRKSLRKNEPTYMITCCLFCKRVSVIEARIVDGKPELRSHDLCGHATPSVIGTSTLKVTYINPDQSEERKLADMSASLIGKFMKTSTKADD